MSRRNFGRSVYVFQDGHYSKDRVNISDNACRETQNQQLWGLSLAICMWQGENAEEVAVDIVVVHHADQEPGLSNLLQQLPGC